MKNKKNKRNTWQKKKLRIMYENNMSPEISKKYPHTFKMSELFTLVLQVSYVMRTRVDSSMFKHRKPSGHRPDRLPTPAPLSLPLCDEPCTTLAHASAEPKLQSQLAAQQE